MPTLVVIIPAYNEQNTIAQVVKNVPRDSMESVKVLVVDDGSTDETVKQAKEAGADHIESLRPNKGLGVAFRTGIDRAITMGADYIVNIDADMQFNPQDIPKLLKPLIRGEADFVVCSRFMDKTLEPTMPLVKKLGNKAFSRVISFIARVHLTDTQCGFRAYTREAALRVTVLSTYSYTQESLIDLVEKGLRVKEVPCKVKGEREGKSRVVDNVLSYALRSITIILRTVRDYRPLEFFGGIGATTFLLGLIAGAFMFLRWLVTGMTTGYQNVITASVVLLILGFLLIIMALQADMQTRQRKLLEEMMYQTKKRNK